VNESAVHSYVQLLRCIYSHRSSILTAVYCHIIKLMVVVCYYIFIFFIYRLSHRVENLRERRHDDTTTHGHRTSDGERERNTKHTHTQRERERERERLIHIYVNIINGKDKNRSACTSRSISGACEHVTRDVEESRRIGGSRGIGVEGSGRVDHSGR